MAVFELIFDFCLEVLLILLYGMSYGFNVGQPTRGDILGATGFPRIVIVIAFVLIAYQIVVLLLKMRREKKNAQENTAADESHKGGYLRLLVCIALLIAYVFLMNYIGYAFATMLFVFAFGKTIGYRNNLKLLIFTAAITIILVLVFGTVFSITLPRGKWFFRELSFYWY